jgi:hypothetical protein
MRKTLTTAGLGVAFVLATALPATAAENPSAQKCENTIARQTENGVSAGGGPKAGIPAPTNCDHYYQEEGLIGSGT